MINQLQKIFHHNKNFTFYLKFHPKSKNKEISKYRKFTIIKPKSNIKFDQLVLSQSSTMIYKLINSRKKFNILKLNTISSLLPKLVEKKLKYLR